MAEKKDMKVAYLISVRRAGSINTYITPCPCKAAAKDAGMKTTN